MQALEVAHETRLHIISHVEFSDTGHHKYAYYQNAGYQIGNILFDILVRWKSGSSIEETIHFLREERAIVISYDQIAEAIDQFIDKITRVKDKSLTGYIRYKIRILGEGRLKKITSFSSVLFSRYMFISLFLLSFLLTAGYIIYVVSAGFSSFEWHHNFQKLIMDHQNGLAGGAKILVGIYCIMPFILLLHELGHASASERFGISAKEIGFGFYLVFPVLYADVTRVWLLRKYKRIIVNLGGIYFQLLCNIPLILLLVAHAGGQLLWRSLFITNCVVIVFSLNPFFRNDGYWIYSDLFQVHNLMKRSFALPFNIYQTIKNGVTPNTEKLNGRNVPLFIYSLGNYIFIGYALYCFALYMQSNLVAIHQFRYHSDMLKMNADAIFRVIRFLLSLCLSLYFFYSRGKQYYIKLKKKYS